MTATSLAPFLAPAAGTFAFLLLLCVTIGAVLTLSPFSGAERLAASENDTRSIAWSSMPDMSASGVEAAESLPANLHLAKQTSPKQPEAFTREAHSRESVARFHSVSSREQSPSAATHAPESDTYSQSVVRWWGINE